MKTLEGKSFIATLQWSGEGKTGPVSCYYSILPAEGGWLMRHGDPVELKFEFVKLTGEGMCFRISGAPAAGEYAGGKLGVSSGGYLGFYKVSEASNLWVLNVKQQASDRRFDFAWVESTGRVVGLKDELHWNKGNPVSLGYLGVGRTKPAIFNASILKWL